MNHLYHCSGCYRLKECTRAFGPDSEGCDLYIRNSYFECHKCLRFGQLCRDSGAIKCEFLPRVTENPLDMAKTVRRDEDE